MIRCDQNEARKKTKESESPPPLTATIVVVALFEADFGTVGISVRNNTA